jgi:hypothetical protein
VGHEKDMQQAITTKRTNEPPTKLIPIGPVDRLDALGQLLYGEQWIAPMARGLKSGRGRRMGLAQV